MDKSVLANIFASISRVLGHHSRAAFILFQNAASSKQKGLRRVCVCDCVEGKDTVACRGQEASCARSHGYIKNNGWGIQTWQSIICKRDAHWEHRQWDLNHFQPHRSLSIYAAELSRKSASRNESGEIIQVSCTQNNFCPFFKSNPCNSARGFANLHELTSWEIEGTFKKKEKQRFYKLLMLHLKSPSRTRYQINCETFIF